MSLFGIQSGEASDLGTSGPFRSPGGATCPAGKGESCVPPVDKALPSGQQVMRHVERALALLDLLRVSDARAALDDALKIDPDDVRALTLRGRAALSDGRPDAARPDIEHAFRLAPGDTDLLATLAALSPPAQALQDLGTVLTRKPDDVDALFARARILLGENDRDAALVDLDHNLAVQPGDVRARRLRAQVNLLRKAYDLAAMDAESILAALPHDHQALQVKAAAHVGAGDQVGAIKVYDAILDDANLMAPFERREALIARGQLYAQQRKPTEAKRDLDELMAERGVQGVLQLQVFLLGHGYPNVEVSGRRTTAFDTALNACFSDTVCGPNLFR